MRFQDLPKKWKRKVIVLSAVIVLLLFAIGIFHVFLASYRKSCADMRAVLVKADEDLIGERIEIEREDGAGVKANLYIPDSTGAEPLPVVFNIHGGGFVGGDADVLDTQSERISKEWGVIVVTVNYTKADVKPILYGAGEIRDIVLYFADNADKYHADASRFTLIGYSAGAYYASEATRLLQKEDFDMASLVMCYPWTTGLDVKKLDEDFPRTFFVLAGNDPISQKAKPYIDSMNAAGIETEMIEYENAVHSFIESNNPEGMTGSSEDMSNVINAEQESLARQAEARICDWINTDGN